MFTKTAIIAKTSFQRTRHFGRAARTELRVVTILMVLPALISALLVAGGAAPKKTHIATDEVTLCVAAVSEMTDGNPPAEALALCRVANTHAALAAAGFN